MEEDEGAKKEVEEEVERRCRKEGDGASKE